jgi:hypothetical protein
MVLIRSGPSFAAVNCFKADMKIIVGTGVVAFAGNIDGGQLIC